MDEIDRNSDATTRFRRLEPDERSIKAKCRDSEAGSKETMNSTLNPKPETRNFNLDLLAIPSCWPVGA